MMNGIISPPRKTLRPAIGQTRVERMKQEQKRIESSWSSGERIERRKLAELYQSRLVDLIQKTEKTT